MTDSDLKELEEKARAAKPGPYLKGSWSGLCHLNHQHGRSNCIYEYTLNKESPCISINPNITLIGYDEYGPVLEEEEAQYFCAANPTAILSLIERLRECEDTLNCYAGYDGLVEKYFDKWREK